jgi:tetratricopeptide (TPR) repeat protein
MTHEPKAGTNLDPEMLAAYIDRRLSPEQRAAVEAELAKDPDSYQVLVETLKTIDAAGDEQSVSRVTGARWRIAVGVLTAAAALLIVVRLAPNVLPLLRSNEDVKLAGLIAAIGDQRLVEARLTGGFRYGPLRSSLRGTDTQLSTQNLELLAAAGALQKTAQADPSVENLHRWGVAQVQLGDYSAAVTTLERASSGPDPTGRIRTDLAAALLVRGATGNPKDYADAVAVMEPVLALATPPREVFFNYALALERLGLDQQAIEAWSRAATSEGGDTGWRDDAERHRVALVERRKISRDLQWQQLRPQVLAGNAIALDVARRQFAQETRELLEDVLLPQFGRACVTSRSADCAATRATVEQLVSWRTSLGDHVAADAINRLDLVTVDQSKAARLVEALGWYSEARAQFEGADPVAAGPTFRRAAAVFHELKSPLEFWCLNFALSADYFSTRYEAARNGASELLGLLADDRYPLVVARTHWLRGLVAFSQGDFDQAMLDYDAAVKGYQGGQESGNVAFLTALRGEAAAYLGMIDEAWRDRLSGVTQLDAIGNVRRRHSILLSA